MIIEERNIILDEWNITIKDFGDKRVISDADKVNMPSEDRLVIGRVRGGYDVYVEHRYSREEITFEKDEETAILWGIIAYIRRFGNVINQEESDYIMKCDSLGHLRQDVIPYIFWGNSEDDKLLPEERIKLSELSLVYGELLDSGVITNIAEYEAELRAEYEDIVFNRHDC